MNLTTDEGRLYVEGHFEWCDGESQVPSCPWCGHACAITCSVHGELARLIPAGELLAETGGCTHPALTLEGLS